MSGASRGEHRRARAVARVILGLLAFCGVLAVAGAAHAQDDVAIQVQVRDQQRDTQGRADNQPLPGVSVTVVDGGGTEIGTLVTDADGVALFPVPGRADYTVRLDESTLPEGKELSADTPAEQEILTDQFITSKKIVNYFTGASQRLSQSTVEKWAQRFADGVRLGLIIAMCSVGLSLIFGTTGLTNFAHGELVTFGALVAWTLNRTGMHILVATPLAVVAGGLLGYVLDRWGFAKLRKRGVGLISQMVITVGLSIMLKNFFLFRFGGRDRPYFDYTNQVGEDFGPVTLTPRDMITTLLSVIVLLAVALSLQYTRLGKATRRRRASTHRG